MIRRDFSRSEYKFCFEAKDDCWISQVGSLDKSDAAEEVCGAGVQGHQARVLIWVGWHPGTSARVHKGGQLLGTDTPSSWSGVLELQPEDLNVTGGGGGAVGDAPS